MQPYFFPYLGYFQLIKEVDKFVIYDNIQYTKKGWINRNRYLVNGESKYITIPLKKDSDYLDVVDRWISEDFDKIKLLNQIKEAYKKAPYFSDTYRLLEECIQYSENNLFGFIYNSIIKVVEYLQIDTEVVISSSIDINHSLKSKDKVIEICKAIGGDVYVNPVGGMELYSKAEFDEKGLLLNFIQMQEVRYEQFDREFVPMLSIIDVLMFNSKETVIQLLDSYNIQ